ncbi:ATP-binding cassette domain-containing protein [Rhodococcoides kyotonense]|uniref:ABC-2 type transport system ATP-binding protein n=1 Tax=Rhodococcoides kyotonense TaxID=398843 RepID=A0A239N6S8_9NOCA|nr:ATP-binding cassette domain-containing protein [Rhodococcus kyotonensis]SNT50172.1 ABC-2 type transport system ATP-binding protein [Rhodococcus kyotonensis]
MIEAHRLTKRYGSTLAVDDLTFTAREGRITALLGRVGAGKSTILRMLLGLAHPTSGHAFIDGHHPADLALPATTIGALLDAGWVYPHRSARTHLRCAALSGGLPTRSVDEVLEQVDLGDAAGMKIAAFSSGMLQRLGMAAALLGDPPMVVVDEPFNEGEPADVAWTRGMLARLARDGRTVLVASRSASEIALLADDLVIIDDGRLLTRCTSEEFVALTGGTMLHIRSPQLSKLEEALLAKEIPTSRDSSRHTERGTEQVPSLLVAAAERREIAMIAASHELVLSEVTTDRGSFEDVFVNLIRDAAGATHD